MTAEPPTSYRKLLQNPISLLGLSIALISMVIGLPMMFLDILSPQGNPYIGILIYLILPAVTAGGVGVAILGIYLEHRRPRARPPLLPRLDLNDPHHRIVLMGSFAGFLVLMGLLSVTAFRAYNFSDSVQFCGQTCHTVMKPEYTAYQHSPHARVACVECHVGPGAGWFVRSKITGTYQLYAVSFNKFPRPIETPIKNLRPAQETCEQCHWPAKFFGAQQKTFVHFMADEKNSPWEIQTLLKIGGGDVKQGAVAGTGIHWHMNIKNEIYYAASDEQREVIPWARVVDKEGHVTEYMSTESPMSPEALAKAKIRRMDCVDCHNRPSHIFTPPDRSLDQALGMGLLDASLPYLKREGMRLLAADYPTEAAAQEAIRKDLPAFYEKNYPALYQKKAAAVQQAAEALQNLYSTTIFPEMKTDWRAHPNHIGHLTADGCFRCHDGLHKSKDGKVITNNCSACHTILAQGTPAAVAKARLQAQPFKHPVDLGMDVTQMKCSTCHTGTIGL